MSSPNQLSLDAEAGRPEADGISPYWRGRAAAFDAENPEVYGLLVRYARQATAAGVGRIGIELLWNRMRWDRTMQPESPEADFKLNQNYKAWYARRIMAREADLADIFETRVRAR